MKKAEKYSIRIILTGNQRDKIKNPAQAQSNQRDNPENWKFSETLKLTAIFWDQQTCSGSEINLSLLKNLKFV